MQFLIDESLSPQLATFVKGLGYDALSVREASLKGCSDIQIIEWAQKNNSVIITGDLDFGELWYWHYNGTVSIIVLRLKSYKTEAQEKIIEFLHMNKMLAEEKIKNALIMSTGRKYRIRTATK
ncbi:DUF5615 family PIN-like protein [Candidatus Woesearchaeota archaeon]|nr:DUF5615 family PIN-like protein [Candidatus Woesearchaeota archaeon]